MAEVEYRDIEGWPGYRVGSDGSVWSRLDRWKLNRWHRLKATDNARGYLRVGLGSGAQRTAAKVHILVLNAFVGPRPEGFQTCHWNGIKTDNRVENLRWGTVRDNIADSRRLGRRK